MGFISESLTSLLDDGGIWLQFDAVSLTSKLQALVGLSLSDVWRPLWQIFEFGDQQPFVSPKGRELTRGQYSVGFTADWAVTIGSLVVMGSGDHQGIDKRRFYDRVTPPRDPEARERWKRAKEFLALVKEASLIVESVSVFPTGGIQIELSKGYAITGFQCNADNEVLFDWADHVNDIFMYVCTDKMSFRQGREASNS